ncbi:MAG: DJ-1/PfpI family protein [Candidatus Sumerlaeia bacterium]|nr:DJ-1/PfpI family protein [Candidatus Sumerlaeia bacterium]
MTPKVLVILADGFEEIEAVTPIDILRRCGVEVITAGLENTRVTGSHEITVEADTLLKDVAGETFDLILLPGGPGTKRLRESAVVAEIVRTQAREGRLLAAICAAPTVLAANGVLGTRRATCFPACEGDMGEARIVHEDVVIDNGIITSRGAGTALPFALAVAGELVGEQLAAEIARAVVYKV